MSNPVCRLLILGSGPAGYSAAVYGARANMSPVLITGSEPGGQLMTTTDVDNWPGGAEGLLGPQLMEDLRQHAERLGTEVIYDHIDAVDLSRRPFTLTGGLGVYRAESLIIATGATARYLGLESEQNYRGKGVSACATCDGFFFKGRPVAVVGGGNTAVEEALYLSNICSSVTVVHRRDALRAEKMMQQQLMERAGPDGPITMAWDRVVEEVLGDENQVTGLKIKSTKEEGVFEQLEVDGVFIAIGHDPTTGLFVDSLETTTATSPCAAATRGAPRPPACRGCSLPAMWPIPCTARRSHRRARAVWRRWTRKSSATPIRCKPGRESFQPSEDRMSSIPAPATL